MAEYPLPNDTLRPGDLCPKSFAGQPENHVSPAEHPEWGICRSCGETVNIKGKHIPEHVIPGGLEAAAAGWEAVEAHAQEQGWDDLAAALEELEATDPNVARAAEDLDRAVDELTRVIPPLRHLLQKVLQAGMEYTPSSRYGGYDSPPSLRGYDSHGSVNLDNDEEDLLRSILEYPL